MKVTYLIIAIILIGILGALQYHHRMKKAGVPAGTSKLCQTTAPEACYYIDNTLINRVYDKALARANADEAALFPTQSSPDFDAEYTMPHSDLLAIYAEMADVLALDRANVDQAALDQLDSVRSLIILLHLQTLAANTSNTNNIN